MNQTVGHTSEWPLRQDAKMNLKDPSFYGLTVGLGCVPDSASGQPPGLVGFWMERTFFEAVLGGNRRYWLTQDEGKSGTEGSLLKCP